MRRSVETAGFSLVMLCPASLVPLPWPCLVWFWCEMPMKYEITCRPGAKTSKKEINRISTALKTVEKQYGVITPVIVVKAAEPKNSPLHRFFEWNNDAAAERYRLWQARMLIARVYVVDSSKPEVGPVRAFVNLELPPLEDVDEEDEDQANQRAYMSINKLKERQDLSSQLMAYAYTQLVGWKRRFGNYKAFLEVSEAIEKVKV